jgi:hypothetical protein
MWHFELEVLNGSGGTSVTTADVEANTQAEAEEQVRLNYPHLVKIIKVS